MSKIAWVCLNAAGVVTAASMVAYTTPDDIERWQKEGRRPALIDFGNSHIFTGRPLPDDARVLSQLD